MTSAVVPRDFEVFNQFLVLKFGFMPVAYINYIIEKIVSVLRMSQKILIFILSGLVHSCYAISLWWLFFAGTSIWYFCRLAQKFHTHTLTLHCNSTVAT